MYILSGGGSSSSVFQYPYDKRSASVRSLLKTLANKVIAVANLGGDEKDRLLRMSEQPGGMIDREAGEVADKGESHFLFEYLACIIGIDGTVLRQIRMEISF